MKHIGYALFAGLTLCALSSCYDDKSTYATDAIETLAIGYEGNRNLYVGYLEQLDLVPRITRGTHENPAGLEYKWEIADTPGITPKSFTEIGTEPELHTIMNSAISTTSYALRLTVTDKENDDLQDTHLWYVQVQSSFIDGLLVSDTKDGLTSDFTLIENKDLTLNYTKEQKIYRDILADGTGSPYDGLMTSLTYEVMGNYSVSTHLNQVWAITDNGYCTRFNTESFSENGNSDSGNILTYKPEGLKFINFFKAQQWFFANTNMNIYSFNPVAANIFGWVNDAASVYTIDNGIVAASSNSKSYACAVWLDAEKGCFVSFEGAFASPAFKDNYEANSYFDPCDMTGYTAVAGGMSTDGRTPSFVLKDKETNEYAIFTLRPYIEAVGYYDNDWNWTETAPEIPASARMKYDIPASGKALLDAAVSIFFAYNQAILYVATADGIYAIDFAGSAATVTTQPKYTPPGGEQIALAKLYMQGNCVADENSTPDTFPELPLNCKSVIVATQKSATEGKVYVVPMVQLGTGNLDAANALSFDGFGRVLDVITIGY